MPCRSPEQTHEARRRARSGSAAAPGRVRADLHEDARSTPGDSTAGPLLVGVDAGTTNTKAVVVDADGSVLAVASEPTPIAYPQPEWAEYEGESLWRGSARAIRTALDHPMRQLSVMVGRSGDAATQRRRTASACPLG